MRFFSFALAVVFFSTGIPALAGSYSFQALGNLSGAGAVNYTSNATSVSADGSVVVGSIATSSTARQSFIWTAATGVVGIGHLPGNTSGAGAHGVSPDGSIVVGEDGSFPPNGFYWSSSGGMHNIGDLPGGDTSTAAESVSADNSIIVGLGSSSNGLEAFRWTAAGGITGLGALPGGSFNSEALAISADGSTIVGASSSTPGTQAMMWTSANGMIGLGDLAGGSFFSTATAVSANGSVIVGYGTAAQGTEAFRWDPVNNMVGLGFLTASGSSYARGVSGDGSTIIGDSNATAYLWTSGTGMVDIRSLLLSHGVTAVSGWSLNVGAAISADGHTIIGTGFSPSGRSEAWIATVPEPSTVVLGLSAVICMLFLPRALAQRTP